MKQRTLPFPFIAIRLTDHECQTYIRLLERPPRDVLRRAHAATSPPDVYSI